MNLIRLVHKNASPVASKKKKLYQQAPNLAIIFPMLYDGKTQRQIGKLIDKPQTTVNYMIKRMQKILQQQVEREDLLRLTSKAVALL